MNDQADTIEAVDGPAEYEVFDLCKDKEVRIRKQFHPHPRKLKSLSE